MSIDPDTDSLLFSIDTKLPHFEYEKRSIHKGAKYVAGVDEAGRGPLAGPVVAAAVILDPQNIPDGLNDSKTLNEKSRNSLFTEICSSATAISWHAASARRIDEINILRASLEAMNIAVKGLGKPCDAALFDGRDMPIGCASYGQSIIKGDAISVSIAAASIVAKVIRDRIMINAHETYPAYGFSGHKGYGSKKHMEAILKHGPCPLHRMSFSPMRNMKT